MKRSGVSRNRTAATFMALFGAALRTLRPGMAPLLLASFLFAGGGSPVSRAAVPRIRLDQVEVTGVRVFSSEVIENAMEIGPGDLLDRGKIVKTAENLQSLYRVHGYEQVSIETRLLPGRILDIEVSEGAPTRIAEIRFLPATDQGSHVARTTWKRIEPLLQSGIDLKADDVLDQERVGSSKRVVQDILAGQEYIGAKVEDVRATTVAPPASAQNAAHPVKAAKWVSLQFTVRLGDRVTFGFRGNKVMAASRLMSLVDEQRTLGLGTDFVSTIGSRIVEEYRSLGYAHASVQPYTFESSNADERHVTYVITEGPRVTIESVDFDGNHEFSSDELRDRFFKVAPNMVQRRYYVEKDVQRAAELLIEWIKSKGYLGAKLVTINRSYVPSELEDERNTRVKLVVYLYESDQTIVQKVHITGVSVFSPAKIEEMLGVKEGKPFNVFKFSEGVERVKSAYRAHGYLGVSIANEGTDKVVHYSDENRSADIEFGVHEGPQYRVSKILIEGRKKTREEVIMRELLLHEGDVLEEPKLSQSESNLRKLGIFSLVRVAAIDDPDHPNMKIVRVLVEEADPGVVAGGPGFRNDLGIRGFLEFGYSNLWGLDHSIFINAAANRRVDSSYRFTEYQAQVAYNWPWFGGWDIAFRPTLSLSGTEYNNFDAVTAALGLNWEKQILRNPNLVGSFNYNLERVKQFDAADESDNGTFLIGSVTPSLRLDLRDNPLAPTSGLFSQVSLDYADPALGSQRAPSPIGYYRLQTRTDYTIPLAPMLSWFLSFRSGFEKSTVAREGNDNYGAIPLIKQFSLGGVGSLRGFSEQEWNYFKSKAIKGTLSYVNYRTQLDLPVSGGLRFGPFLDAANLQVDSFSFGNLRYGAGFGFHYLTPVGPVNLDWGFKLDPRPGEDTNQFYFSIGVL